MSKVSDQTNAASQDQTNVPSSGGTPINQAKERCKEIAKIDADDTHAMASKLLEVSLDYYQDVRRQALQSFYSALGAALVGILFFIYACYSVMHDNNTHLTLTIIVGSLIQVISGINFVLYARTTRQFSSFHICLERTNRFLLVNTLCENLIDKKETNEMRKEVIRIIANAPMLTLDILENRPASKNNPADGEETE